MAVLRRRTTSTRGRTLVGREGVRAGHAKRGRKLVANALAEAQKQEEDIDVELVWEKEGREGEEEGCW